jgi:hypothetical protein
MKNKSKWNKHASETSPVNLLIIVIIGALLLFVIYDSFLSEDGIIKKGTNSLLGFFSKKVPENAIMGYKFEPAVYNECKIVIGEQNFLSTHDWEIYLRYETDKQCAQTNVVPEIVQNCKIIECLKKEYGGSPYLGDIKKDLFVTTEVATNFKEIISGSGEVIFEFIYLDPATGKVI